MACIFGNTQAFKNADYATELSNDLRLYTELYANYGNGNFKDKLLEIPHIVDKINAVVKEITFGQYKDLDSIKDNEKALKFVNYALVEKFKVLAKASDNPQEALSQIGASKRAAYAFKIADNTLKTSTGMYKFFRSLLKPFGLSDKIELWAVRPNLLREYEPAYDVYFKNFQLANFADNESKKFVHIIQKFVKDNIENNSVFKNNRIDEDVFGKIFPIYDKQREKQIGDSFEHRRYLGRLLSESNIDYNNDTLAEIDAAFRQTIVPWNQLNYGTLDVSKGPINVEDAQSGTILGLIKDMRSMFFDIHESIKDKYSDETNRTLNPLIDVMKQFKIREGYIPGLKTEEEGDIFSAIALAIDKNIIGMPEYWFSRSNNENIAGEGDFIHTVGNNLLGTAVLMQKMSLLGIHDWIDKTLADPETNKWFDGAARRKEIYAALKFWQHDIAQSIKPVDYIENSAAQKIKKITSFFSFIPAMIMWFPATAVRNTLVGTSNLFQATGLQTRRMKYAEALKNDAAPYHNIANFVRENAEGTLIHTGLAKEFEMFTMQNQPTKDVLAHSQNFFMKLSDLFGGSTFLRTDISEAYLPLFSLKGSETRLREQVEGLIFNRIIDDMKALNVKFNPDNTAEAAEANKNLLSALYKKQESKAFYETTRALGDFSPLAKPYWTHGFQDNAETGGAALTGALLKWWYMFRHPMLVNTENFIMSFDDVLTNRSEFTGTSKKNQIAAGSMVGIGLFFAIYELLKDIAFDQEVTIGTLSTLDPFQDLNNPVRLSIASILVPIFGLRVSEINAKKIQADNLRFLGGMLSGRSLSAAYKDDPTFNTFMDEWTKPFRLPETLLDIVLHGNDASGKTALYDRRYQFRDAWGGLTNLDPVWAVERLIEYATIKDPSNPEVTAQFRADTMLKNLASITGISTWHEPTEIWNSYGSKYWHFRSHRRANNYIKSHKLFAGNGNFRTANYVINSIERYGYAPTSKSEIPRLDR